jgi:hypothetical protein
LDDDDFVSATACCECGGGTKTRADPTQQPWHFLANPLTTTVMVYSNLTQVYLEYEDDVS